MSNFKAPPVPDAVYQIRSAERSPALYLEWQSSGDIQPTQLNANTLNQKWRITSQQDGTYRIFNMGNGAGLSILPYQEQGQTKYRLFSGGQQAWTLDARGETFVIGDPESAMCVDIPVNNYMILWERRNALNQRWFLDPVNPIIPPGTNALKAGTYNIVNVASGNAFYPMEVTTRKGDTHRYFMHPANGSPPADFKNWSVEPIDEMGEELYRINAIGDHTRCSLFQLTYWDSVADPFAVCQGGGSISRIIPTASGETPGAFYIVTKAPSRAGLTAIWEESGSGSRPSMARASSLNRADKRQQWMFVP